MTREEAVRHLLGQARERGVELEVLSTESRDLSVDAFGGEVSEFKQAQRGGLGVRAVVDGKAGYAWTEELTDEALDWVLDEALENALLQEEDDAFLPEGRSLGRTDMLSEGLSAPIESKTALALEFERELQDDPRHQRTQSARYAERESRQSIASSKGAQGDFRVGYAALMASILMRQGESVKQGFHLHAEKEFHSLEPGRTALEMLHRTGRLLGAEPLPTGRYRAFLEPEVVAALLKVLEPALSGKALVEGRSRFDGRLGQRVASEAVTLVDDPLHSAGLANRPFDSEGTPTARLTVIEQGVLRSFLHNSYTARRAGHANTGHAHRSYQGTLGVSPSNLLLLPGEGVEPRDGVVVSEVMGLHAGANPISGDFSLQALGLRVEDGESRPVENFVISGNLFRMLERVVAVGREPEWVHSDAVFAPMVEIDDLSFAGA